MATKYKLGLDEAQHYLNDPLTEPEPSEETGLNATFRSTFDPITTDSSDAVNKAPVESTTPAATHSRDQSLEQPTSTHARKVSGGGGGGRSRGNSLTQRYPGDMSHHPLAMLKQDAKKAHRSPHLRSGSIPGIDAIDSLDPTPGGNYHHEGPYDATLASRNQNRTHSPVAAVFDSNVQTLRATPPENIKNALDKHYPLDGVAEIAPGATDRNGKTYNYEETDGYLGEETIDDKMNLVRKKEELHNVGNENAGPAEASGIELADQPTKKHVEVDEHEVDDETHGHEQHHTLEGLKKRIGSLRKKKD